MQRDHKTYAEVLGILQKQMPELEKIPLADFVIYNNTNIENLQSQTLDILHKLQY
jgi:dephospho-CoA kinase